MKNKNLVKHILFISLFVIYAVMFLYYLQNEVDLNNTFIKVVYFLYLAYVVFMELWDDAHDLLYLLINIVLGFVIGLCVLDDIYGDLTLIAVFLKFAANPLYFGIANLIPETIPHLHSILFVLIWVICTVAVLFRIVKDEMHREPRRKKKAKA